MVTLLFIMTVASLLLLVRDTKVEALPLYDVPKTDTPTYIPDSETTVQLTMTVCMDDTVSHVSMMAQEWAGDTREPGVIRVFTTTPGCHQYTFTGIPIPSNQDPEAVPCDVWSMTGAVISYNPDGRPSEEFTSAPSCIGGVPELTPCDPGTC